MWTHEMRFNDPIRQQRENLYRERSAEIVSALRVLSKSKKPHAREFGEHWLQDYLRWVEATTREKAA